VSSLARHQPPLRETVHAATVPVFERPVINSTSLDQEPADIRRVEQSAREEARESKPKEG
jgi:hypothetical protein